MRTQLITLAIRTGTDLRSPVIRTVSAWQVGTHFAVHRSTVDPNYTWLVTHIPTGLACAAGQSRDAAVRRARALARVKGINWDTQDVNIVARVPRHVRNEIRRAAGLPPLTPGDTRREKGTS